MNDIAGSNDHTVGTSKGRIKKKVKLMNSFNYFFLFFLSLFFIREDNITYSEYEYTQILLL